MIDVNISRVDNGYVVRAGCMTLAFDDRAKLAVELTRWLENPDQVEKEYIAKYRKGGGDMEMGRVESTLGLRYHAGDARVPFPGGIHLPTDTPMRERLRGEDVAGCDAAPRNPRT